MRANRFEFEGETYTFHIQNEQDAIQKCHAAGKLFDFAELKVMAAHIKDGDFIADIGANVGNHTVFFAKKFPASKVMPFEPNNHAELILRANLEANKLSNVDTRGVGFGLSDIARQAMSLRGGPHNLGGSKVIDLIPESERTPVQERHISETGNIHEVRLLNGDETLFEHKPNFIKIDVEGHEFSVLRGLQRTIETHRPTIFIEVQNSSFQQFEEWMETYEYITAWTDTHYKLVTNVLIIPK